MDNTLDAIDCFKKPMPTFNMRGRESIPSYAGCLLSFAIACIMVVYASIKFSHLMTKHNPSIASFTEEDAINPDDKFNFRDNGLKFAFGIEGFID